MLFMKINTNKKCFQLNSNNINMILDRGKILIIIKVYKRWDDQMDDQKYNFTVTKNDKNKFMFIECRKNLSNIFNSDFALF